MVRKIIVHKKGYSRKAYTRKDGTKVKATKVKPSSYKIRDRGAPGRGKKIIPKLEKGTLGVNFSNKAETRHRKEAELAKKIGEKRVQGKLQALATLNKRTNPVVSLKAQQDRKWVAKSFVGKRRVRFPSGMERRRR